MFWSCVENRRRDEEWVWNKAGQRDEKKSAKFKAIHFKTCSVELFRYQHALYAIIWRSKITYPKLFVVLKMIAFFDPTHISGRKCMLVTKDLILQRQLYKIWSRTSYIFRHVIHTQPLNIPGSSDVIEMQLRGEFFFCYMILYFSVSF